MREERRGGKEDRRGEWPIPARVEERGEGGKGRSVTWLFARVTTIRRFRSEDTGARNGGVAFNASMCNKERGRIGLG